MEWLSNPTPGRLRFRSKRHIQKSGLEYLQSEVLLPLTIGSIRIVTAQEHTFEAMNCSSYALDPSSTWALSVLRALFARIQFNLLDSGYNLIITLTDISTTAVSVAYSLMASRQ